MGGVLCQVVNGELFLNIRTIAKDIKEVEDIKKDIVLIGMG